MKQPRTWVPRFNTPGGDMERLPGAPLLSRLGHELRSPLTGILGLSRIMLVKLAAGAAEPGQQINQLELLRASAEQMLRTIDRVVEVARLDLPAGPAPEPSDCRARIAEVVAQARPGAEARGRQLLLDLPDEPVLIADRHDALRRILAELVDNAVKYADHPDIRVSARPQTENPAAIEVSDDGPGLTDEEQARLGNPFERGAAAERDEIPGSGLGLYLARQLVGAAGLRMVLRSGPPAGTTVTVLAAAGQHRSEGSAWPQS